MKYKLPANIPYTIIIYNSLTRIAEFIYILVVDST